MVKVMMGLRGTNMVVQSFSWREKTRERESEIQHDQRNSYATFSLPQT